MAENMVLYALPRTQLREAARELTSDQARLIVVGEPTPEKGFVEATTEELASELQEALRSED